MEYMESRMQDQIEGAQCENEQLRAEVVNLQQRIAELEADHDPNIRHRHEIIADLIAANKRIADLESDSMRTALSTGGALEHGVIRSLEEARNAADQARRDGLYGLYPAATIVLDMAFSRIGNSLRAFEHRVAELEAERDAAIVTTLHTVIKICNEEADEYAKLARGDNKTRYDFMEDCARGLAEELTKLATTMNKDETHG